MNLPFIPKTTRNATFENSSSLQQSKLKIVSDKKIEKA